MCGIGICCLLINLYILYSFLNKILPYNQLARWSQMLLDTSRLTSKVKVANSLNSKTAMIIVQELIQLFFYSLHLFFFKAVPLSCPEPTVGNCLLILLVWHLRVKIVKKFIIYVAPIYQASFILYHENKNPPRGSHEILRLLQG